ncbi:hypothetical protein HMPREF1650_00485 [Corynebacterium freneyi DNF00450]|uniref:Uncharacterized protein n=1 Tax=Corynebacterium freneyi DNF00450 TaxID=1287475 RepID=A0A095YAI2_9CORY|nr:hypothetical protein HMPREF1650_00485 [Corynebacterium freneyi DNF00450]
MWVVSWSVYSWSYAGSVQVRRGCGAGREHRADGISVICVICVICVVDVVGVQPCRSPTPE